MAIFAVQTVTTIAPLQQAKQALCAPSHTEGTSWDGWGGSGDDDTGIEWEYLHSGFGIARITAVNGTTATAEVISYIPSQVVGEDNASYKWAKYAWNSVNGYPGTVVLLSTTSLLRRIDSVPSDYLGQPYWGL